jgi:hypothetical protein
LLDFVQDLFVAGDVSLVSIPPEKTPELVKAMRRYKLDFDDAYQYLAAKLNGLTLVTFDKDLRRKPLARSDSGADHRLAEITSAWTLI